MKRLSLALAVGYSVVAYAPLAVAQDEAKRDAQISICVAESGRLFPGTAPENQLSRTAAFKACMTKAGFKP
jgi:hypothetical protein